MQAALNLTGRLNAAAIQGGLETVFSVKMLMNAKKKAIAVAVIQNVSIYQENTNVCATMGGPEMDTIALM